MAQLNAPPIASAAALARRSWPGLDLSMPVVVVEEPARRGDQSFVPYMRVRYAATRLVHASGALEFIPEALLRVRKPIDPAILAPAIISNAVLGRRRIVPGERDLVEAIVREIAIERTGSGMSTAIEAGIGGGQPDTHPILDQADLSYGVSSRLVKVLAAITYRVGSDRLALGINDFAAANATPGTVRELLAAIGRRGGVSLDRVYEDYFAGRALPILTLDAVKFVRSGDSWIVRGMLRNDGTGEAFCPLVLRTAFESSRTVVRVDSHDAVPFELSTPFQPRALQLDPEGICYRWAKVGVIDNADYGSER
jgi:hypothetical protein